MKQAITHISLILGLILLVSCKAEEKKDDVPSTPGVSDTGKPFFSTWTNSTEPITIILAGSLNSSATITYHKNTGICNATIVLTGDYLVGEFEIINSTFDINSAPSDPGCGIYNDIGTYKKDKNSLFLCGNQNGCLDTYSSTEYQKAYQTGDFSELQ